MAQEYGAAQPVADVLGKAYSTAKKFLDVVDNARPAAPAQSKKDTAWRDEMLKQANESFNKQPKKVSSASDTAPRKRTASKKTARKRVSGKS